MTDLNSLMDNYMNEINDEKQKKKKFEEWVKNASPEDLNKVFKSINPYGVVLPDKECNIKNSDNVPNLSISYTNYTLEFAQSYATTSLIAFLYRMLYEYKVPEEVPAFDIENYIKDPSIADPPSHITDERLLKMYEQNKKDMDERIVIWKFLNSQFEYDPDLHVRSSYKSNKNDPERRLPNTDAIRKALIRRNTIRKEPVQDYEAKVDDLNYDPKNDVEKRCFNHVPSVDFFLKQARYRDEHHEQFLQLVQDLYGLRPDMDFSICVYDKHKNKEDAEKFKRKHQKSVIASIINIDQNRWALLGPYQQNRARIDFYNEHTEALKQMIDKRAQDEPVATDIMKKKIKIKKKKNREDAGDDDEIVKQYFKDNKPDIAFMGGEHVTDFVTEGEKTVDDVCPDDAVEVNMFNVSNGGMDMSVHKIYNPVEEPSEEKKS